MVLRCGVGAYVYVCVVMVVAVSGVCVVPCGVTSLYTHTLKHTARSRWVVEIGSGFHPTTATNTAQQQPACGVDCVHVCVRAE